MEEILGNELWNALVILNPVLAAAIVAVTSIIKSQFANYPRWVTIGVGVLLTAIYYFVSDGTTVIQLIAPLLAAVFAYDFIVKPIQKSLDRPKLPGGGGTVRPKP
jgi:hypothetical protein